MRRLKTWRMAVASRFMYLANAARDLLVIGMGADCQYSRNSLPLSLRYSYPQRKQEKKASGSNDAKIKENRQNEAGNGMFVAKKENIPFSLYH